MANIFVYAGNWTVQSNGAQGGIGIFSYDSLNGSIKHLKTVRRDLTAGVLLADCSRKVLYCVDEAINSPAFNMQGGGGRVLAFSIDPHNGELSLLGEQPAFGSHTCYLALDGTKNFLVAVNHGDKQAICRTVRDSGGRYSVVTEFSEVTAALFPLGEHGELLPACHVLTFPHDTSQIPPKLCSLHSVHFAPDGVHCVITSMKHDQVFMYRLDREKKQLIYCDMLCCRPGSFPRYAAFNPEKRFFYLNNEHQLFVTCVEYDESGRMKIVQELDSTPEVDFTHLSGKIMQSDMKISPDGRFVYILCRGCDTAAAFRVGEDGMLSKMQSLKLDGAGPRGFSISPDGRFILVANTKSSEISTLSIADDGTLSLTGIKSSAMEYPGDVVFAEI